MSKRHEKLRETNYLMDNVPIPDWKAIIRDIQQHYSLYSIHTKVGSGYATIRRISMGRAQPIYVTGVRLLKLHEILCEEEE